MKSVTMEFCHGSNDGTAIYLNTNDDSGSFGFRIAGPKCWGEINCEKAFKMNKEDLEVLIREAKKAIDHLE